MIKKRILTTLAMMAVLLSLAAIPAMAQSQLDQSQTTVNNTSTMDVPFVSQTFTAGQTGRLDKVSIYLGCCEIDPSVPAPVPEALQIEVEGTQYSLQLYDPVQGSSGFFDDGWVDIPLDPAPFVQAGEQYRINLSTDPSLDKPKYRIGIATSDVYSGGEFHYAVDFGNGIEWFTKSDWDMAFQTYVTPSDDPPPDTTAPKVDSVKPANSTTSVSRRTNATATFSEKMAPATINKSTFKLYRCPSTTSANCTTQLTNVTVTTSADGLSATLNPYGTSAAMLAAGARYKAIVTTGAKDVAGNALDQNASKVSNQQKVWYFSTIRR